MERDGSTINQFVARNMALLRTSRGWTQSEAAERLAPYLGVRWSKASYSAAESCLGAASTSASSQPMT